MTNGELALIAALEQRVAALENRPQAGTETLSPTYLTNTPSGRISAVFPGGVSVPELSTATAPPPVGQSYNFTPIHGTGIGGLVAFIDAAYNAGSAQHTLNLNSYADPNDYAVMTFTSTEAGAIGSAAVAAQVTDSVGGWSVTIIDSAVRSSFPQLAAGVGRISLAFGSVSLTWAASTISNTVTVNHNIGRTPQGVWLTPHDTGNTAIIPPAQAQAAGTTTFQAQAVSQVSGSYSVSYAWLAIG